MATEEHAYTQLKPIPLRIYEVEYQHKSDFMRLGEDKAQRYADRMDTETLRYFLLSPDIVVQSIVADLNTFFF